MQNVTDDTKKSRGRPARLDKAKGTVIAEQLFHTIGYDQLGVSEICDALGVRQPALYRVFGSKTGIYKAALENYLSSPFATFIGAEMDSAKTPHALSRNVLLRAVDIYTSDPARKGCLALETAFGSADETASGAAKTLVEQTRTVLAKRFDTLGAPDAHARANAVMLMLRGLSSEARMGRSQSDLRQAVESFYPV